MTAAIDYPDALPIAAIGTLQETSQDSFVNDSSEVGAPRRRARFTRALRRFSFVSRMSEAERQSFDDFYKVALSNGVLSFNWTHPLSKETLEVRFNGKPSYRMLAAHMYDIAIEIEEL